ncbi:F-box protein At2g32560-like [Curcuma longa]|uniref:F-box protein At2g32560-like n=1 Tax=Curcuma longa TaxID=136217 RepID=UPI003D9E3032
MAPRRKSSVEGPREVSIMDLPELALECILEKLPPAGLCSMAAVCSSLREICTSDYLWEKHMRQKWGRLIGPAAQRAWKLHLASAMDPSSVMVTNKKKNKKKSKKWIGMLSCFLPACWLKTKIEKPNKPSSPDNSIMSLYRALELGEFRFPAQVYNREHGHMGFMLSCYDAEVSYDCRTDTFRARYPPNGRRTVIIEEGVEWDRLRPPPMDTPAYDLHISDCLNDLQPGDHIEIQWRRNKEFPYGWWYGVIDHLESCDANRHFCRCHLSDTVVMQFNQYTPGSRWRRAIVNRKDHREEGSDTGGFYGGIRKLKSKDEVSKWRQLWPSGVLN